PQRVLHSSPTRRSSDLKDGGSSVLSIFIAAYKKEAKGFTGPGLTEPVVILYDNDTGAKSIRNAIKNVSKVSQPEPSLSFTSSRTDRKSTRLNSSHGSIS